MIRRQLCTAMLTVILILSLTVPVSAGNAGGPGDVVLSWTGGTNTTVTVSWHADEAAVAGVVLYGTDPSLDNAAEISAAQAVPTSGIVLGYTVWQAAITGLKPDTRYYYAVENGGLKSGVSAFTTGESDTSAFSFLYMGDIHMGVGSADLWGKFLNDAYQRNPAVAFGIFGGDIVDSGISAGQWQDVLDRASPVFSKIPLMPVNGNHESNFPDGKPKLYLDLFDLPKNGPDGFKEEFYSYDYGSCHITVLNSWVFSGEQKLADSDYKKLNNWLMEDLASSHAKWKIVVMHHPVYEVFSDKVADAVRKNWAPLFEKGGVGLVLCGHQHVYSRSYPMTEGQIDYTGGITTVMGNASQKFYSSADETYQAKTVYGVSCYQIVKIDGDTLTVQAYDPDGNELDYASLGPRTADGAQAVFSDVSNGVWYATAVNYAAERGLMTGTADHIFSPGTPVTRSMAATLLYRLAGSPGIGSGTGAGTSAGGGATVGQAPNSAFSDVPANAWYGPAVSWLSENGILSGTGGGRFSPDGLLTREQLASMLFRFTQYEKSSVSVPGTLPAREGVDSDSLSSPSGAGADPLSAYSDGASVSVWAADSLRWAIGTGLLGGTDDGFLHPGETATRAQCAQILMKFCLAYAR